MPGQSYIVQPNFHMSWVSRSTCRLQRGEKEKEVVGATGLGKHYNIGGGLADSGPVDTERA